jgi:hypothetical protein
MTKSLILSFALQASSPLAADHQPFGRPLIPDMVADPAIIDLNGTFYCYATTDGWGRHLDTSGTPVVWKSKDFVNWSFEGSTFPDNFNAKYWAPSTLFPYQGHYYSFPTLDGKITAVVADSPDGPFRTLNGKDIFPGSGWQPFPIEQKSAIDAEVFIYDGQPYMVYSRRRFVKLKPDLSGPDGPVTTFQTGEDAYSEGPFLFKRNDTYYYLYTLGGGQSYAYAYLMSRVSPLGPWTVPPEKVIAKTDPEAGIYGPGHGCFFQPQGSDQCYFVHLEYGRGSTNRQIYAQKLEFNVDGTIRPVKLTNQGVGALRPLVEKTPNFALRCATTASSTKPDFKVPPDKDKSLDRTETFAPALAVDDSNGSRWMATDGDTAPWWQIDLGAPRNVTRTEAYFVKPAAGHAYKLEWSLDGKTWHPYGGHKELIRRSPHRDAKPVCARYLKLIILQGTPGLWEFRVY